MAHADGPGLSESPLRGSCVSERSRSCCSVFATLQLQQKLQKAQQAALRAGWTRSAGTITSGDVLAFRAILKGYIPPLSAAESAGAPTAPVPDTVETEPEPAKVVQNNSETEQAVPAAPVEPMDVEPAMPVDAAQSSVGPEEGSTYTYTRTSEAPTSPAEVPAPSGPVDPVHPKPAPLCTGIVHDVLWLRVTWPPKQSLSLSLRHPRRPRAVPPQPRPQSIPTRGQCPSERQPHRVSVLGSASGSSSPLRHCRQMRTVHLRSPCPPNHHVLFAASVSPQHLKGRSLYMPGLRVVRRP